MSSRPITPGPIPFPLHRLHLIRYIKWAAAQPLEQEACRLLLIPRFYAVCNGTKWIRPQRGQWFVSVCVICIWWRASGRWVDGSDWLFLRWLEENTELRCNISLKLKIEYLSSMLCHSFNTAPIKGLCMCSQSFIFKREIEIELWRMRRMN